MSIPAHEVMMSFKPDVFLKKIDEQLLMNLFYDTGFSKLKFTKKKPKIKSRAPLDRTTLINIIKNGIFGYKRNNWYGDMICLKSEICKYERIYTNTLYYWNSR
jgi:hypothetical protein